MAKARPNDPRSWNDPPTEFEEVIDLVLTPSRLKTQLMVDQNGYAGMLDQNTIADMALFLDSFEIDKASEFIREQTEGPGWHFDTYLATFRKFRSLFINAADKHDCVLAILR